MTGKELLASAGAEALELGVETAWKALEARLLAKHPELNTEPIPAEDEAMFKARDEALRRK